MFKPLAIFLVAGLSVPATAAEFDDLQLVYHATFANGSLESAIDPLSLGPLKLGKTAQNGINAFWTPQNGDYSIGVTQPTDVTTNVIAGIYASPVNFDVGSVFGLRATFVAPSGPHDAGDVWAVGVGARTGFSDDIIPEPRATATLQVRGATARFNTPGASVPANFPAVPQEVYDAIFRTTDPQPFTLEILVDRKVGRGEARLKVGEAVFSRTYEFAVFKTDSGPAITTIGANLAIANAPGDSASVRLRDFQIYSSKRSSADETSDPLCPPELGCRLAPSTE